MLGKQTIEAEILEESVEFVHEKKWIARSHLLNTPSLLRDWRGHLMVAKYAGYRTVFTVGHTELACLTYMVSTLVGKSSIYELVSSRFFLMLTE